VTIVRTTPRTRIPAPQTSSVPLLWATIPLSAVVTLG
jgi:hypothetical protein